MSTKTKDIVQRMIFTFFEAFIGAISVEVFFAEDRSAWKPMLASAVAVGLSAVINFARHRLNGSAESESEKEDEA